MVDEQLAARFDLEMRRIGRLWSFRPRGARCLRTPELPVVDYATVAMKLADR